MKYLDIIIALKFRNEQTSIQLYGDFIAEEFATHIVYLFATMFSCSSAESKLVL